MPEIIKNITSHKNFYPTFSGENEINISINIYMYEPDNGINEDTGILLFIAGFGGHSNSNVYKKCVDNLLIDIILLLYNMTILAENLCNTKR